MKYFIGIFLAFSLAHSAYGMDICYMGAFGGLNWVQRNHFDRTVDPGFVVGVNGGYRWCNGIRTELEFSYRNNFAHGHCFHPEYNAQTYAGLVNVLYDFPSCNCGCFTPFAGGGIGYAYHKKKECCDWNNRSTFAWQLIAGIAYPCFDCVDLTLSYRLFSITCPEHYNHGLTLGLNYPF